MIRPTTRRLFTPNPTLVVSKTSRSSLMNSDEPQAPSEFAYESDLRDFLATRATLRGDGLDGDRSPSVDRALGPRSVDYQIVHDPQ
jgi:hypothetical protein